MQQQDSFHQTSDAVGGTVPLGWSAVQRPWDSAPTLVHTTKPIWIVRYHQTQDRAEHWHGYRAVAKASDGRALWTVDNRRIGSDRGFASLDAAIAACEEFAAKEST